MIIMNIIHKNLIHSTKLQKKLIINIIIDVANHIDYLMDDQNFFKLGAQTKYKKLIVSSQYACSFRISGILHNNNPQNNNDTHTHTYIENFDEQFDKQKMLLAYH
ncbi:hypothetical protein DERP_015159 [Dermatophagoides pteronyssinus]|uniref:Uncharacterized protein n=1 Tax=Dermatophagoides pteronyssinus TaxID=6956 RepID=A0ABQ8JTP7_DERPT|nr:hypothetical protein DERP_015159 [Dermatophagoides pteronyssinus]